MANLIPDLLQVLKTERDDARRELDELMAVVSGDKPPPADLVKQLGARLAAINHRIWEIEKKVRGLDD